MRAALLSLSVLLAFASVGRTEDPVRTGIVTVETEIKASKGWNTPTCGKIAKDKQVKIHHEDGEFYAILPPEGSKSWVSHLFLQPVEGADFPKNAFMQKSVEKVRVRVGTDAGPTNVEQVQVQQGYIFTIVGKKVTVDGQTYYPIAPPPGEYRYIPKTSVNIVQDAPADKTRGGVNAAFASLTKDGVPATTASRGSTGSNIGSTPGVNHSLWTQAEQAYRSGDYAQADKLYTQIYQDMNKTNNWTYDEKLMCFNRVAKCQEKLRATGDLGDAGRIDRTGRPIERSSNFGTTTKPAADASSKTENSGKLYLRRAAFTLDGKQAYALENDKHDVVYYAIAQEGVTVDAYVGKWVDANGSVRNRGDLGRPVMTIAKVKPK